MRSLKTDNNQKAVEHGRIIARAMDQLKVEKQKNMMKAEKRRATMLENSAEKALSGINN